MRYLAIGLIVVLMLAASVAIVVRSFQSPPANPVRQEAAPEAPQESGQENPKEPAAAEQRPVPPSTSQTALVREQAPSSGPQAAPVQETQSRPEIQLPMAAQGPNLFASTPLENTPLMRAPELPSTPRAPAKSNTPSASSRLALSPPDIEKVRHILLTHNIMQTEAADFPLRVGAIVPEGVNLSPLPIELSDIVPAYAQYSYVIVQNQIAIVVSGSREIRVLIPVPAPA